MILASILSAVGIAVAKPAATAAVEGLISAINKKNTAPTAPEIKNIVANNGAAIVPVKSKWFSKINWVAGIALAFGLFDFFGHPLPADAQAAISKVVTTLAPLAIIVLRSWFNNSATK